MLLPRRKRLPSTGFAVSSESRESGSTPVRPRILRYGSRGEVVRYVQNRLSQLDYGTLNTDGVYGFLTEEAVRALQRDFHLHPDGVVGPEVWELLQLPRLPSRYLHHTVKVGESMADIAARYGITVTALREANRIHKKSHFRPGLRLSVPSRLILGIRLAGAGSIPAMPDASRIVAEPLFPDRAGNLVFDLNAPAPRLSRVVRPYPPVETMEQPAHAGGVSVWGNIALFPEGWLADPAFGSRRWRRNLRAAVQELASRKGLAGVNVTVGPVPANALFQTGVAVNEVLRSLQRAGREAMLTLAPVGDGGAGFARSETMLGRFIRLPAGSGLVALLWQKAAEAEKSLPALLTRVRCWRLAIGPAPTALSAPPLPPPPPSLPLPPALAQQTASVPAARRMGAEFAILANRYNLAGAVVPAGTGITSALVEGCREHFHLRHDGATVMATAPATTTATTSSSLHGICRRQTHIYQPPGHIRFLPGI